jgi:hypothetical protein
MQLSNLRTYSKYHLLHENYTMASQQKHLINSFQPAMLFKYTLFTSIPDIFYSAFLNTIEETKTIHIQFSTPN